MVKINVSFIKELKKQSFTGEKYFGDDNLKGFGLRWQKGSSSYVFKYRNAYRRQRTYTIGNTNKISPDEARRIAKEIFSEVTKGNDPCQIKQNKKKALTVSELCDWYMKEGTAHKKSSTLAGDKGRIERHIKPLIGHEPLEMLTRGKVEKMMYDIINGEKVTLKMKGDKPRASITVRGGKTAASRTIGLLGAILQFAINHNQIKENPVRGIKKPADRKKDVFLTLEEIKKLGKILEQPELKTLKANAVNTIKLLLLTGCRKTEILSLKWEEVDFQNQCFRFTDTKTGKQTRPFGAGAYHLLIELNKQKNSDTWIFPSSSGSGYYKGLPKTFSAILKTQDETGKFILPQRGITIHTLRHTFASIGADIGYTELTLAGLLGHSVRGITNRYSHTIDKSLMAAANTISLKIEEALTNTNKQSAEIINLERAI